MLTEDSNNRLGAFKPLEQYCFILVLINRLAAYLPDFGIVCSWLRSDK
jgi:hypothetical protein